jgi:hypothetical protein
VTSDGSYTAELAELTEVLRAGSDPFWVRLRQLLEHKGVDPQSAVLAESFEDGSGRDGASQEFGIVVTVSLQVFEFVVQIGEADGHLADAYLREWVDKTEDWKSRPFANHVREAISSLQPS